jgi:hypothetical protein
LYVSDSKMMLTRKTNTRDQLKSMTTIPRAVPAAGPCSLLVIAIANSVNPTARATETSNMKPTESIIASPVLETTSALKPPPIRTAASVLR